MNKAGLSPHRKKSLYDASMIAHASVIGVSGSVNNPDCLPARSRDTLSKERCQKNAVSSRNSPESTTSDACRRGGRSRRTYIRNGNGNCAKHGEKVTGRVTGLGDEVARPQRERSPFRITCSPRRIDPRDFWHETRQQTTDDGTVRDD